MDKANMSDDIVTRLRNGHGEGCSCFARCYCECGCDAIWAEHYTAEAADEIEYLRSEMANVNSEYNKLWRKYEQALKDNSTLIHVCQDPEGRWVRGE